MQSRTARSCAVSKGKRILYAIYERFAGGLSLDDSRTRFQIELEFVQCLANPSYLNFLAQQGCFEKPAFVNYLQYLRYWKEPTYSRYLM
ncbi:hypothetical protein AHF37_06713 [Paragonimus kellicotti]|nr:hypothetical protein AHF37_06713 [Paragonimus kellicotti]